MSSQLGCVDFASKPLPRVRGTPYCSRLGGLPSYFPSTVPHQQPHPRCCACSLPLFLVLQLYAPAEKERTLYVFGCNNASCSMPPGEQRSTWVVLRSQGALAVAEAEEGKEEVKEHSSPPTIPPTDEWGSGGDWGESLEPATSGGGGAAESLLWGERTTTATALGIGTTTAPPSSSEESLPDEARGDGEERCLPAFEISTVYLEEEEEGDSESESEEEGESSGGPANAALKGSKSGGGKDWEYAQRLWERYSLEEKSRGEGGAREGGGGGGVSGVSPEVEAAATAAAGGDWGDEGSVNDEREEEEEEEEADEEEGKGGGGGGVKSPSKFMAGKNKGGGKEKRDGGGCGGGGGGEKYEKTPAKVRYMLRFQQRIASYPSQVLRYCWDAPDTALWPCVPLPISPPPCSACGSKRQLEVQVLPTILYGLKVEEHALNEVEGRGEGGRGQLRRAGTWEGGEWTSSHSSSFPALTAAIKDMASGGAAGGGPTTYKVLSISVMRWNNDTEEPILLEAAYNLAEYSFFTRGSVKEFLTFASRTVMKRVTAGSQALDYEGNIVYCVVQPDGLGVIVITDKSYPGRVALKLARETLEDFKALHGATWRRAVGDCACKLPKVEESLLKYQEPTNVDKILKLDKQLNETKEVLYQTIDKVLARGEKLDELVAKSDGLSAQSKLFYKQAKKTNACCIIM